MAGAGVTAPSLLTTPHHNYPRDDRGAEDEAPAVSEDGENEDVGLGEEEQFLALTAAERAEWEAVMCELSGRLEGRRQQFQNWCQTLTRRRMLAYARARRLLDAFRQRALFDAELAQRLTGPPPPDKVQDKAESQGHARVSEGVAIVGGGSCEALTVTSVRQQQLEGEASPGLATVVVRQL